MASMDGRIKLAVAMSLQEEGNAILETVIPNECSRLLMAMQQELAKRTNFLKSAVVETEHLIQSLDVLKR